MEQNKKSLARIFKEGAITNNPTFVMVLGMCPTLAVTTSAINGLGMGASVIFVLLCSSLLVSMLRKFIPDQVRIPCFIVVIASFSTIVQMLLEAFLPSLNASLGIFIPLIVVNCIILERAESFASKNGLLGYRLRLYCSAYYNWEHTRAFGLGQYLWLPFAASGSARDKRLYHDCRRLHYFGRSFGGFSRCTQ